MIDYKNKNLSIKTNQDKVAKLMVLANKKNNDLKKRKISPLDIQPMEHKENYKTEPNIPSNQKISATDWNAFVDNIDFLNKESLEMLETITRVEKELQILNGSNSIVNIKTKFKNILPNFPTDGYKWYKYSNVAFYNNQNPNKVDDYHSRYITGAIGEDLSITRNFENKKIWKSTWKNIESGDTQIQYVCGELESIFMQNWGDKTGEAPSTVYRINTAPLNYLRVTKSGSEYRFRSLMAGAGITENAPSNILTNNMGIVVAHLRSGHTEDPKPILFFFPTTDNNTYDDRGGKRPSDSSLPKWRVTKVEAAIEEPYDLMTLNNWLWFIYIQLQYNSKWSKDWGTENEKEDPTIKSFIPLLETNGFELSSYKDGSSTTFQFKRVSAAYDKEVWNATWLSDTIAGTTGEQKIQFSFEISFPKYESAKPSAFFKTIFGVFGDGSDGSVEVGKPCQIIDFDFSGDISNSEEIALAKLKVYEQGYLNLWTNVNQSVLNWNWYFKII